MSSAPSRGEIWEVDWSPGRGAEQTGRRPALIIQNDFGNHSATYPNTIVATVSTKGRNIPFHVALQPSPESGLRAESYVKCEQLLTISKDRLLRRWGRVAEEEMRSVDQALKRSLSLT
jgi:mRNA interferase MazF